MIAKPISDAKNTVINMYAKRRIRKLTMALSPSASKQYSHRGAMELLVQDGVNKPRVLRGL